MKLAIIIPYFKLTFFRETLESLASQTNQRFTVYIGNDASTENPEVLLKSFEGKFNFKYKKFESNLGETSLTRHWGRCIEMIEDEEWFMILGDDDYLSSNVVQELYSNEEIINSEEISVIKLNSTVIDGENEVQFRKKREPLLKSTISHFFDKFGKEGRSSLSEHFFRKSKYVKYGFRDLPFAWHSDDLALLEFSEFGVILFLENATCYVRISLESITGNKTKYFEPKRMASKMFFDLLCENLNKFSIDEKRRLFDIIQWYEKDKKFEIQIPNKFYEFFRCYGFLKTIKILL